METNEDEQFMVQEMKALIRFCEVTDNMALRITVKHRLKVLSGITSENEWSNTDDSIEVHTDDKSHLFTRNVLNMIKDYFIDPNQSNLVLANKYDLDIKTISMETTKFFKLSPAERKLILKI